MPNPDPWLQYGALGLLGLVLLSFAGFMAIFARWAGQFLVRITAALERVPDALSEVREEMAEFKAGALARLQNLETRDGEFRAKLDSLPREIDLLQRRSKTPEPHISKNPTVKIPKETLQTLRSESERRPELRRAIEIGPRRDGGLR